MDYKLNIILKTINISRRNIGVNLHNLELGHLDMTPKAQATTEKTDKLRLHQNFKLLYLKVYHQRR